MKNKKLSLIGIVIFTLLVTLKVNAQTTLFFEDFNYVDGTTVGPGTTPSWTTFKGSQGDWFEVLSGRMEGKDLDGEAFWKSEMIDISNHTNISVSLNIEQAGSMASGHYLNIYYRLDGGLTEYVISENSGAFGTLSPSITGINGDMIEIYIRVYNTTNFQFHYFDNILVQGDVFGSGPENPVGFDASSSSDTQIDLTFSPNAATDDIIIVRNNTGLFNVPTGTPPATGNAFAGGTLLYSGTGTSFSHTGLTACENYFYKAWSYDGSNYSIGTTDNEYLRNKITLPWEEDFEGIGTTTTFTKDEPVINGSCKWTYEENRAGKLQFEELAYLGSQSAALAAWDFTISINYLTATLDLSNYLGSNDLTLSFYHLQNGNSIQSEDKVWIRGSESNNWIEIYDLGANNGPEGEWVQVVNLDIDDVIGSAGQSISSSFQLRFGQEGNNGILAKGRAFDNISIDGTIPLIPIPPTNFSSQIVSGSQIDLSFDTNPSNHNVLIIWNTTGVFSIPDGPPPAIGESFAGGTVLSYGTDSPVNHFGLSPCVRYYYRAMSYNGSYYSNGVLNELYLLDPVVLPWTEGFEGVGPTTTFTADESIINGTCVWSYYQNLAGRLQFDAYSNTGSKGAAMDVIQFLTNINHLTATINLSNYTSSASLELSFYHMSYEDDANDDHPNDKVWVRGSDSDSWIEIYDLYANQGPNGTWVQATGLDIDAAIAGASQTITSSFQLRFGQEDNNSFQFEGRAFDDIMITGSVTSPLTWTGTTSKDWNVGTNWNHGFVPTEVVDVVIPGALSNYPESNSGDHATCDDLTLESGAHLYVPADKSLTVSGTLTNNGDVNSLKLFSANGKTSSLIHNTSNVEATVDLTLNQDVWHYISSPLSNALSDVYTGLYLRPFDEPTDSWGEYITSLTSPLNVLQGYATWAPDPNTSVSYQGTLNNGNMSIGVTCRDFNPATEDGGWNMVGNPYPSAVDWDAAGWTKDQVDNTIYFYSANEGAGNYYYYQGSGGELPGIGSSTASSIIPPMQGFFVHVQDDEVPGIVNGTLGLTNETRIHANQTFYKDGLDTENSFIRLVASDEQGLEDETIIRFFNEATPGVDPDFDAYKLMGYQYPQLYSLTSDLIKLAINTIPEPNESWAYPLGFIAPDEGIFCIGISEMENVDFESMIYLEDVKESTMTNLSYGETYCFYSEQGEFNDQFILHMLDGLTAEIDNSLENSYIYSHGKSIHVYNGSAASGKLFVHDILGKPILSTTLHGGQLEKFDLKANPGIYVVTLAGENVSLTEKVVIGQH